MKTLLLFICLIFSSAFFVPDYYNIGETIISTDTFAHEIEFNQLFGSQSQLLHVFVNDSNSGHIKFKVGDSVNLYYQNAFYSGSDFPITIINGQLNLFYKASTINQRFVVTN